MNRAPLQISMLIVMLVALVSILFITHDGMVSITGYTTIVGGGGNDSTLIIYDDLDISGNNGLLVYNYKFYANYTNTTTAENISSAVCYINFTDLSDTMAYNDSSLMYEYVRNFNMFGTLEYSISCYAADYEQLNATDNVFISSIGNCDSCELCSAISKINNATVNLTSSINSSSTCIDMDGAEGVIFECNGYLINSTTGSGYGIDSGDNANNATFKNCNISFFNTGIRINGSNSFSVNLTITNHAAYGILLAGGSNHTITTSKFYEGEDPEIYLTNVENVTILNSQFHGGEYGIITSGTTGINNLIVKNNNFTSLDYYAILIQGNAYGMQFIGNNISNSSTIGGTSIFSTSGVFDSNISNNVVNGVNANCIQIISARNTTLSNNVLNSCGLSAYGAGVEIISASNVTVNNNNITNTIYSVKITSSSYLNVFNNHFLNATYGIYMGGGSYYNTIKGNEISGISGEATSAGVYVQAGTSNVSIISNNILTNSTYGVYVDAFSSPGLIILNNTVENNTFDILSKQVFDHLESIENNSVFFKGIYNVSNILSHFFLNKSVVALNASLEPGLNVSANITLEMPYGTCPAKIYYSSAFTRNYSEIIGGNRLCNANTNPACTNIVCSENLISFNVPHFDGYAVGFGNSPETNSVVINTTFGTNFTTENITIYYNSSDPDNDTVVNITDWRVNGISYARLNVPFEGGSNSTWTRDYSTYEKNMIVNGSMWVYNAGHNGYGAYVFDGVDDYLYVPLNASDFSKSMAASVWFKTEDGGGLFGFSTVAPVGGNYDKELIVQTDGDLVFRTYPNDPYTSAETHGFSVNDGGWHHVAISIDMNEGTFLYLDGVLVVYTPAYGTETQSYESYFTIGINTHSMNFFNGIIDDLLIFNRSISAQEVLLLNASRTDISEYEIISGEIWSACITPNDGTFDGTAVCSNEITIRNKPEISSVYFNQTNQWQNVTREENNLSLMFNISSNQNVTFNATITADPGTFTFSWFVDGALDLVQVLVSAIDGFTSMFSRLFLTTGLFNITVVVNSTEAGVNDTFTFYANITCLRPSADGFVINEENEDGIRFCPGSYLLTGNITINKSDVYISCDGATLTGIKTNNAFQQVSLHSISNITIRDCVFRNFKSAISLNNVSSSYFLNNSYYNNTYGAIRIDHTVNSTVSNSTFIGGQFGVVNIGQGDTNTISYNNFYNLTDTAITLIGIGPNIIENYVEGSRIGLDMYFNPYGGGTSRYNFIGRNIFKNCTTGIKMQGSYVNLFEDINISFAQNAFYLWDVPSYGASCVNNTIINPIFANNTRDIVFAYNPEEEHNNTLFINDSFGNSVKFALYGNVTNLNDNLYLSSEIIAVNSSAEPNLNVTADVSLNVTSCTPTLYKSSGFFNSGSDAYSTSMVCDSCGGIICANNRVNFTTTSFSTIFAYYPTTPTGGGGRGGSEVCTNNWVCNNWGACTNGIQTRRCTVAVLNDCVPDYPKPEEQQFCGESIEPIVEVPSSLISSTLTHEQINLNLFACAEVGSSQVAPKTIIQSTQDSSILSKVKQGFEVLVSPFKANCEGNRLSLSISLPDYYTNVSALRCSNGVCRTVSVVKKEVLSCGEKIESASRTNEYLNPDQFPLELVKTESKPGETEAVSSRTKVRFVGDITGKVAVDRVFGPVPEAKNPKIRIIGTPTEITLTGKISSLNVTLPYVLPNKTDELSAAVYALKNNEWNYLGGDVDRKAKVVRAEIKNPSDYAQDGKLTLSVMALVCLNCYDSKLTEEYAGTSRDAVLFVHGFENSPERFEAIINDMKLTNQPWQAWTFGYPSSKSLEENAREMADLLQANSKEYDVMYIVAHSLGGLVTQEALNYAYEKNKGKAIRPYPFVDKVAKVVSVASPNKGSLVKDAKILFNTLLNNNLVTGLFNLKSDLVSELLNGKQIPRLPRTEYLVVAGTQQFDFTSIFNPVEKNDGLVSLSSAQTIGNQLVDDYCSNFWSLNTTHFDLLNNYDSRKVIERIISSEVANEYGKKAILGYNQYYDLNIDLCNPDDQYIIIGVPVDPKERANPGVCSCGNGVCGIDETIYNCPVDCARIEAPKEAWWMILLKFRPVQYALMTLLLIIVAVILFSRRRRGLPGKEELLNDLIVHTRIHMRTGQRYKAALIYSRFVEEYNSSPAYLKEKMKNDAQALRKEAEEKLL